MSLADTDLIPQVETIVWLAPPRRPRKQSSHGKFNVALIVSRYLSNYLQSVEKEGRKEIPLSRIFKNLPLRNQF